MVNAALIVMTILGCDDTVSQCHYIKTVKGSWESVAACDQQSQAQLPAMQGVNYPVVVAMCETAGDAPIASAAGSVAPDAVIPAPPPSAAVPALPPQTMTVEQPPAPPPPAPLPQRAFSLLKGVLPDGQRLKRVLSGPVHSLGEGYSWIAHKVSL